MSLRRPSLLVILGLALLVAGCRGADTETALEVNAAGQQPFYLAIIWHQHQPVYFKDPETGLYARPWVRVHATKDYVDMAAILTHYPDIHATFNLTPSLIRQLDDLQSGAKDIYWAYAETPAESLNEEQKRFILERFFDTNREIIARFPRYQQLLSQRDAGENGLAEFTAQDFRDLQVLFNLAWVDPDWLAQAPLAALVAKGENFNEADKQVLFEEHLRLVGEVIPLHRRLQETGQIEVTMTPFAHPILPLLVTTQLAREALPEIELPSQPFVYGQDAAAQVELGVDFYEEHFGQAPRGMWPAEGSVAQEIVTMVSQNGIQWMASDEGVLANSLGLGSFERDANDTVLDADTLYRPYFVQGLRGDPVAILFRDTVISDKVGFTYSGMPGEAAAADFVARIYAIREQLLASGEEGPHLVTVLLDGENAWEHYKNDGKEFLHSLYQQLSDDPLIKTVTPSEFLTIAPQPRTIEDLWAGSWINHDFATWIGEEEENRAWDLLAETRSFLQSYITGTREDTMTAEQLDEALLQMYIAEGSDWFWWYGRDQNSGNDDSFDAQFRATLKAVYQILGEEAPTVLDVPIISQTAAQPHRPAQGLISPTIDGQVTEGEWNASSAYLATSGLAANANPYFGSVQLGFDSQHFYLALRTDPGFASAGADGIIGIYLSAPGGLAANSFTQAGTILGFGGEVFVEIDPAAGRGRVFSAAGEGAWTLLGDLEQISAGTDGIELAVPLDLLGSADIGDLITLQAFYQEAVDINGETSLLDLDQIPGPGPAQLVVPDLGNTTLLALIEDPEGDDHGPGSYTYPQDAVFNAGNFDILSFEIAIDEENVIFKFSMRGPVDNAWDSPNGLSLQTFDIYIDADQDGQGGAALLPGRNLALETPFAWDYAVHVEGWYPGMYIPTSEGIEEFASPSQFQILADPGQRKVTVRIPKVLLGDNPEDWALAAMVLSQEGFPSGGVMRVRDVLPVAEQWRIGGGPRESTNHTRVMDLVWPQGGVQEEWLGDVQPTDAPQTELTAGDFARVQMFLVSE